MRRSDVHGVDFGIGEQCLVSGVGARRAVLVRKALGRLATPAPHRDELTGF
jgi:hypothetical protein